MIPDELLAAVREMADDLRARGAQYRIEVQPTPTESIRVTSDRYVERDERVRSALDEVSDEDLLDELRDRLEAD